MSTNFILFLQSPIRRYADVVAHRQLLMCVEDQIAISDRQKKGTSMTQDSKVNDICDHLNLKSRESKFAQRVSDSNNKLKKNNISTSLPPPI